MEKNNLDDIIKEIGDMPEIDFSDGEQLIIDEPDEDVE